MSCKNEVSQWVHSREIVLPCGSIGIDGRPLLCDECEDRNRQRFPHGWRQVPGDVCKHGNYVGNANGADHICGHCERG